MKWIILALAFISLEVSAGIGTITEQVNKPPSIERSKTSITGAKGTGIEMNDAVRTTQGKVGITFEDDTKVQISDNSKLVIDDFVYDPKAKSGGKLAVKVALGTVRYASGQIAKTNPQNVSVNTPSATIGVRGTDFTATVDEIGASTIILLPSCPFGWIDIARDCKTGEISVTSDVATVILNKPFQATKVENRGVSPLKPVILNLSEDSINNMLIVSPPKQLKQDTNEDRKKTLQAGALDVDFLKETGLVNVFEAQEKEMFQDKLSRNLLDQNFLENILDVINRQLAAQLNMLNNINNNKLLPDWNATTGITVELDEPKLTLCRDDGSNVQCVTTRSYQNSTIYQTQGSMEFKNRVNSGGNTIITLIQK
jgi:hypothetical protein